ncbi:MAG: tetratricopeptide repeat protein, partial [Acidobacteriota bacterium]
LIYLALGRYDEAIEHYEELRRQGMSFPGTYGQLAGIYGARGHFEQGHEVLEDFIRRNPDNAAVHRMLGGYLSSWGRLDDALAAYEKAESLEPGHLGPEEGRWNVFVQREQWERAEASARKLLASDNSFRKWQGWINLAGLRVYHGRSQEAAGQLEASLEAYSEPNLYSAISHLVSADSLLAAGRAASALEHAQKARREGEGDWPEWWALIPAALAQARLGRWKEARESAAEFQRLTDSIDAPAWERDYHLLMGELALVRGDASAAVGELQRAESLLPPRGWSGVPPPPHVPIWFALASAHMAAGDEGKAAEWFRRIVESSAEHVPFPLRYVRSFYFLGRIHENRGEMDKAREHHRRFVDFWRDGDLDRGRVIEALDKIKED